MKKILVFLLIAALLAGGYFALDHFGMIGNGGTESGENGGENGDESSQMNTITKDQWLAAINSTNHSMVANSYLSDGGDVAMTQQQYYTESGFLKYTKTDFAGMFEETAQYAVIIDGIGYQITKQESGYVGEAFGEVEMPEFKFCDVVQIDLSISSNDVSWEELYDYLVYDETSKTYKTDCIYSGNEATFEAFFEDGKAVKFEIKFANPTPAIITYSNFGTTVIEVPEFTLAARTTITKDEWLAAINSTNHSMVANSYLSDGGDVAMTRQQYYTESGFLMYTKTDFAGIFEETAQYSVIIDGIGYQITKQESGYVGEAFGEVEMPEFKFCDVVQIDLSISSNDVSWEELYDYLVYDETSKTYKTDCIYSGNEATFEAFFEDGKAVKFEIKFANPGPVIITYSNFGTTIIEVPEFTLAE